MGYSHIDTYWQDIDEQLMRYIDRYFEIRFGNIREEEKAPMRSNEKGALLGYLQAFNDKNGKWMERVNQIRNKLIEIYRQRGLQEPQELINLETFSEQKASIGERIKIPLKALYRMEYQELLNVKEPIISYDANGNFERINLKPEKLKMAISLFALIGSLANRVAHSTAVPEEANEAYEYKHQMMTYLITSVYDYNKTSNEKMECKFARLPSKSDGHSYPTITVKLPRIGKISLHYGGGMRNNGYVI